MYVPIRPICDFLGVAWSPQRRRINRDPILAEMLTSVTVTVTKAGQRGQMLCLPLEFLNGWIFGINADRVKPEIRERLLQHQREYYRLLAEAFLMPSPTVRPTDESDKALVQLHNMALVIAATTREMLEVRRLAADNKTRLDAARDYLRTVNERLKVVEQRTAAGLLTEEQAGEIKKRVKLIAQEMSRYDPSKSHYQAVYAALGDEAGVTSYKYIPPKGYEAAITFLDNWLKAMQQGGDRGESI